MPHLGHCVRIFVSKLMYLRQFVRVYCEIRTPAYILQTFSTFVAAFFPESIFKSFTGS